MTFDPTRLKAGERQLPKPILVDLNDSASETSPDPMVAEAARKFPGFKYEIRFEENRWAVSGSSVVASITIYRLSGDEKDAFRSKEFLTRSGTPLHEFWTSPSREQRDRARLDPSRRGG